MGWSCEYIQVKWANLEEVRVRRRKRGKEVRGDEKGQPFTCGKKKTRCLYWVWKVAQLDHPCPCTSIAPCFHYKLHALSLSLSLSLVLEGDNKVLFFFGESCGRKTLGFAPKIKPFVLFCSVLFVWNFEQALKPYRNLKLRAIILGGLNPSPILLLIFPRLGSQLGLL